MARGPHPALATAAPATLSARTRADGQRIEELQAQFLFEPHAAEQIFNDLVREAKVEVVIGDARVSLIKAPDRRYDIFILDAFSSDMIPAHLLTREAIELYLTKTAANGLLLFHISNRYLDLAPVLARLATDLKLVALIQNDTHISSLEAEEGKLSSRWVILARGEKAVDPFLKDERWHRLDGQSGGELWTDEFSNVVKVISWR